MTPERKSITLLKNALRDRREDLKIFIAGTNVEVDYPLEKREAIIDKIQAEIASLTADIELLSLDKFDAQIPIAVMKKYIQNYNEHRLKMVEEKSRRETMAVEDAILQMCESDIANLQLASELLNKFNKT